MIRQSSLYLVPENLLVHFFDKNLHLGIQLSRQDPTSEISVSSLINRCQCSDNTIAKSCRYYLRCIGRIRKYLSDDDCKTLVHALVTSRLDYGNVLLLGLPEATLNVLQRVQNCAARIITRTRLRNHTTPVLLDLHWLPRLYYIRLKF